MLTKLTGIREGVKSEFARMTKQVPDKARSSTKSGHLSGMLGSSVVVAAMTMLSRIAGLARDVIIAIMFGASSVADAFFVAFRIPQFLRRLFAEGAFAQAFVPVLTEYKSNKQENGNFEAVKSLVNAVAGVLAGALFLVTAAIVIAAPVVAYIFAPGFASDPEKFELVVQMLRITFPYLMLISLTGMAAGILNSYGRFWVPAFTPVILNLCLIAAALWVSPRLSEPVFALAWAVLIAGFAQLLFQLPFLAKIDLLPKPVWDLQHPGVRKILKLMLPAIFGVSVSQINLLLDTVLASFLPSGSVSWLYYSDRLVELPLGVFGIAIATVLLPGLSAIRFSSDSKAASAGFSEQSAQQFCETLDWALRCIFLLAIPASAALFVLAEPILYLLFQYEAMLPADVQMAALSLRAYALGLLWFMAIKILAAGYYAQQDTRTPVRIGIIAMASNMVFNLIFVAIAHNLWAIGHVGLALATAVSAAINAILLFNGLRGSSKLIGSGERRRSLLQPGSISLATKIVVAAISMVLVLLALLPEAAWWVDSGVFERGIQFGSLMLSGLIGYALVLLMLGVRPRQFNRLSSQEEGAVDA